VAVSPLGTEFFADILLMNAGKLPLLGSFRRYRGGESGQNGRRRNAC
jgi:hypothetical protein